MLESDWLCLIRSPLLNISQCKSYVPHSLYEGAEVLSCLPLLLTDPSPHLGSHPLGALPPCHDEAKGNTNLVHVPTVVVWWFS